MSPPIGRQEICPSCGAYFHSCLNCRFYSGGLSRGCREPQAEEVRDRSTLNFCDFFVGTERRSARSPQEEGIEARARFDSLFKKV